MEDFTNRFKSIIADINDNIHDEKEREYINKKVAELSMLNMKIIEEITSVMKNKIDNIEKSQKLIENKLNHIEASVTGIENDMYNDEFDFEIVCPYCNTQFVADIESKSDIKCPECQNVIELDWGNDDNGGCTGHCSMCNSKCNDSFFDEFADDINFIDEEDDNDEDM